jgi:hypothetical protein
MLVGVFQQRRKMSSPEFRTCPHARGSVPSAELVKQAIAPTPVKKRQRSQKLSTSRPPSNKVMDELETDTLIKNPRGDRGWVDKRLRDGRYQVTFENGLVDNYPPHLPTV